MSGAEASDAAVRTAGLFAFGDLVLDSARREVTRDGQVIPLTRLSYRLLTTLVHAAPGVVTQDELMSRVWPGQVVSPETLTQRIRLLRRALDDDAQAPRYIGLTRREGYRLLPPVIELPRNSGPDRVSAAQDDEPGPRPGPAGDRSRRRRLPVWPRPAVAIPLALAFVLALLAYFGSLDRGDSRGSRAAATIRLAVLPFEGQNGDASQKYFSVGIAEELTMRIARLPTQSLTVVGSTAPAAATGDQRDLAQIARTLDADYVLDGTFRRDAEHVYVTARLTRTEDASEVWAASYERDSHAIVPIQSEIARSAARAIGPLAAEAPPTQRLQVADGEGHEAYLRGRYLLDGSAGVQNLDAAIAEFRRAIARDPENADAYAAIAFCYNLLGSGERLPPGEAYPAARAAAHAAIELDPGLADAWAALGFVRRSYDWDWRGAEDALREALRLDPKNPLANHVLGLLLSTVGRHDEAIAAMQRSTARDPMSPISFSNLALVHVNARQYERARAIWDSRRDLLQNETVRLIQGDFHLLLGEYDQALEILEPLAEQGQRPDAVASLARLYASVGRTADARELLLRLESHPMARYALSPHIARVYAALGDMDTAFHWLDVAIEEHAARLIYVKVDPAWDPMRGDPRFAKVLQTMGLNDP